LLLNYHITQNCANYTLFSNC